MSVYFIILLIKEVSFQICKTHYTLKLKLQKKSYNSLYSLYSLYALNVEYVFLCISLKKENIISFVTKVASPKNINISL